MYAENGMTWFIGDFNASYDIEVRKSNREQLFFHFVQCTNLVPVNSLDICSGTKSTFVTYDNSYESIIDFNCIPVEMYDCVTHCEVMDDSCLNVSRHRPVLCKLEIPISATRDYIATDSENMKINWKKVSDVQVTEFQRRLKDISSLQYYAHKQLNNQDIDKFYEIISSSLNKCAGCIFPKKRFRPYLKPYWNSRLTELHDNMTHRRNIWCQHGRPKEKGNEHYTEYKSAKREFRRYHRYCTAQYMTELDREIDQTAELDSRMFWKLVNNRRKQSYRKLGAGMKFNDTVFWDQQEITEQWGHYFKKLYTPTADSTYDSSWKTTVEEKVRETLNRSVPDQNVKIVPESITSMLQTCPLGKASGADDIAYEHLIYGGAFVSIILASLFTGMLRNAYIPDVMKRGIILTMHKGGNKSRDDPNNYRAITLTSTVLKLFEMVLVERTKPFILQSLSPQQGGFQEKLGCLMTSFVLRESIWFSKENSSKLHICFLDAKQAFDRV
ncbi:uncharacterized protein LOC123524101 [Mercenaria mercenaria]|uniref:uncharacterized protein LOC123524101 n=1 Tax=Mercenaria mercenaria TaxID=6596 RepID=UPI00234F814A|nr:uncharacterized protein LOC123524101 [Mercenaria mercenaria]